MFTLMICIHLMEVEDFAVQMCLSCLDSILYYEETEIMNKKKDLTACKKTQQQYLYATVHIPQKLADTVVACISIMMFIIIII